MIRSDELASQATIRERLAIDIGAARRRGESLDHVLLSGPPGPGRTAFAHPRRAKGVESRETSAPGAPRPG